MPQVLAHLVEQQAAHLRDCRISSTVVAGFLHSVCGRAGALPHPSFRNPAEGTISSAKKGYCLRSFAACIHPPFIVTLNGSLLEWGGT